MLNAMLNKQVSGSPGRRGPIGGFGGAIGATGGTQLGFGGQTTGQGMPMPRQAAGNPQAPMLAGKMGGAQQSGGALPQGASSAGRLGMQQQGMLGGFASQLGSAQRTATGVPTYQDYVNRGGGFVPQMQQQQRGGQGQQRPGGMMGGQGRERTPENMQRMQAWQQSPAGMQWQQRQGQQQDPRRMMYQPNQFNALMSQRRAYF